MSDLKKQKQAALEAVARRFAATWEKGRGPSDIDLTIGGKRIAVEITLLKRRGTGKGNKPGLRFDKVVTWLMDRLQTTFTEIVPDGMTVALTVTAPIRLPGKTADALEDKVQTLLARRSPGRDVKATVHGNRVQIRLLRHASGPAPRMIGFVHNPDSDPVRLLNITGEMFELISAMAGGQVAKPSGVRWLVAISGEGFSWLQAYRYIYSQLRMPSEFKKVLMVFGDGSVEDLTA